VKKKAGGAVTLCWLRHGACSALYGWWKRHEQTQAAPPRAMLQNGRRSEAGKGGRMRLQHRRTKRAPAPRRCGGRSLLPPRHRWRRFTASACYAAWAGVGGGGVARPHLFSPRTQTALAGYNARCACCATCALKATGAPIACGRAASSRMDQRRRSPRQTTCCLFLLLSSGRGRLAGRAKLCFALYLHLLSFAWRLTSSQPVFAMPRIRACWVG
jgi:hypothetical protein